MALDIEAILKDLKALPVAPQILPKLQSLLGNLNTDTSDLVDLIKLDSGLAAKVLKLSNSAYYARGREVAAIDEAIGLIGYQETFRVVAHSSYSSFMNRPIAVFNFPGYGRCDGDQFTGWQHELRNEKTNGIWIERPNEPSVHSPTPRLNQSFSGRTAFRDCPCRDGRMIW